jgi:hypothetical protein
MGYSRKRQSILVGLAKVCAALAPNMQFYFYRIDMKVMGAKWSRALALLLCKEEWGLLESLVLEVLEERLRYIFSDSVSLGEGCSSLVLSSVSWSFGCCCSSADESWAVGLSGTTSSISKGSSFGEASCDTSGRDSWGCCTFRGVSWPMGRRPVLLRAVRQVRAIYHLEREEYETIKFYKTKNKSKVIVLANNLKYKCP